MKTIKREKSWPGWAKYKTMDYIGREELWSKKPLEGGFVWLINSDCMPYDHILLGCAGGQPGTGWEKCIWQIVDEEPAPDADIEQYYNEEPDVKQNPKHIRAQKDGKCPMEYLCYPALMAEARVLKHGADKYGVRNWRIDKILASTYEGAIMRHLLAWATGADADPDSGESHLAHIRACCAVVLDAIAHDTLIDDRDRKESKG